MTEKNGNKIEKNNNKKCLITQDLVSALEWQENAPESWKDKANEDLLNKLNRAPFDFSTLADAAKIGIDMEKQIARCAKMHKVVGTEHMQKLITMCIGGEFQKKLKKGVTIDGYDCFLYGKADVAFSDKLYDIKTTKKYNEDKYAESFQGLFYSYINKTKQFDYLVAELTASSTIEEPVIKDVHIVESGFFGPEDVLEKIVFDKIRWTIERLKAQDLWEVYRESYCLY